MTVTKGQFIILFELIMYTELRLQSIFNPTTFTTMGPHILDTMLYSAVAFLGMNVLDNGVKGKFFNPNLQDRDSLLP